MLLAAPRLQTCHPADLGSSTPSIVLSFPSSFSGPFYAPAQLRQDHRSNGLGRTQRNNADDFAFCHAQPILSLLLDVQTQSIVAQTVGKDRLGVVHMAANDHSASLGRELQ